MAPGGDSIRHAITDVYDESNRTFLIRFPLFLLAFLLVSGILAFLCVGYFGYPDDPWVFRALFYYPWPVFTWLALLFILIQVSILRHQALRRLLLEVFLTSFFSITLVGSAWYAGFVGRLTSSISVPHSFFGSPFPLLICLLVCGALVGILVRFDLLLHLIALLLTVFGTVLLLIGADFTKNYLHTASRTLAGDPRVALGHLLAIWLLAALGIIGGLVAAGTVCAVLVWHPRVLTNFFTFTLVLIVFLYVYLPVFAFINSIVWLTGLSYRTPFFQPSVGGLLTVVIFILYARRPALAAYKSMRHG